MSAQKAYCERTNLIEALQGQWTKTIESGEGRFVLLDGHAGTGKTTLVEKLFVASVWQQMPEAQFVQVVCKAESIPGTRPIFQLIYSPAYSARRQNQSASGAIRLVSKVANGLAEFTVSYWPDLVSLLPYGGQTIAAAHALEKIITQYDLSSSGSWLGSRNPLKNDLKKRLDGLTNQGPLIVFLDECQNADPAVLEFLPWIAEIIMKKPILVVLGWDHDPGQGLPSDWTSFKAINVFTPTEVIHTPAFNLAESEVLCRMLLGQMVGTQSNDAIESACRTIYINSEGQPLRMRVACDNLRNHCQTPESFERSLRLMRDFDQLLINLDKNQEGVAETLTHASLQGEEFNVQVVGKGMEQTPRRSILAHLEKAHERQLVDSIPEGEAPFTHLFTDKEIYAHYRNRLEEEEIRRLAPIALEGLYEVSNTLHGDARWQTLRQILPLAQAAGNDTIFFETILEVCHVNDAAYARQSLKDAAERGLSWFTQRLGLSYPEKPEAWGAWVPAALNAADAYTGLPDAPGILIELLLYRARAAELLDERIPGTRNRLKTKKKSVADEIYCQITDLYAGEEKMKASLLERGKGYATLPNNDRLAQLKNMDLRLRAYLRVGYFYHWENFHSDVSTCVEEKFAFGQVEKLIQTPQKDVSVRTLASALCGVGFRYRGKSLKKGEPFYEAAMKLARKNGWTEIESTALHNLGFIYFEAYNDHQRAWNNWVQTLQLRGICYPPQADQDLPFDVGNTLAMMGGIAFERLNQMAQQLGSQASRKQQADLLAKVVEVERLLTASIRAQGTDTSHILGPYISLIVLYSRCERYDELIHRHHEIKALLEDHQEEEQLEILDSVMLQLGLPKHVGMKLT